MNPIVQQLVNKHLGLSSKPPRKTRPSEPRKSAAHHIEVDTPIIPIAIAEGVINKAAQLLNEDLQDTTLAERLVDHAERIYQHNSDFRRRVKASNGRDYLWNFMQHWLTSELQKSSRYDKAKIRRVLIQGGFSLGRDIY